MTTVHNLYIKGLPNNLSESQEAVWRSRFYKTANDMLNHFNLQNTQIIISTKPIEPVNQPAEQTSEINQKGSDDLTKEERAKQYKAIAPLYTFDFLILPKGSQKSLLLAVSLIKLEDKVFNQWNLRKIEPFPRTSLNFYGEPGTGKTLAAHAIANYFSKPIMVASYAQIESKFHGEGPKNVEALFYAAERDNAVLFIDEADSLLSKRLTNVTQGSEQAINSMRSQLLICLEHFKGIVIFATNLVKNYDRAFETRVRNIQFPLPDEENRLEIWNAHIKFEGGPPLAKDVSISELAKIDEICGRDIKNAVIDAALNAAQHNKSAIEMNDLIGAITYIKTSRIKHQDISSLDPADKETKERIRKALE